ncbi:hypothetical protein ACQCVP_19180 [Rossellomorea vietnamensis]|uniref:RipA family octameric membrane protein n=1 Tax=Rossellomorea vietnamensis TaxID=218284 RepID=UPI003CF2CF3F
MDQNEISDERYKQLFKDKKIREEALKQALDIRKFEIELYWKRATYFWAFIAVSFAGYFAILGKVEIGHKSVILFLINCLGFAFSYAWYLVNRGSKFWQDNWERHVDFLEDEFMGPLYKSVISRQGKSKWYEEERYSVSKINQILSFFLVFIWGLMIINTIYFVYFENNLIELLKIFTYERTAILILFVALCIFIGILHKYGKTNPDDKKLKIRLREHPLKEGFTNENGSNNR